MRPAARLWQYPLLLAAAAICAACSTTIASSLEESQANDILVALDGQGIGADKGRLSGGTDQTLWEVSVAPDDVARALAVLRAQHLPRRHDPGIGEVFGEGSLVPTATEERARYAAALSGELTRSIESMDGVLDARVHLAIPETRDFALDEERPRPRASVLVKHTAGADAPAPEAVQALVAGAVHGMQREDVAVVVVAGRAAADRSASLVRVGPIAVTQGSAFALKLILGIALGLNLVLALALILVWMRKRRPIVVEPAAEPG